MPLGNQPTTTDPELLLILQTLEEHQLLLDLVTTPMQRQIAKLKAEISAVETMLLNAPINTGEREGYQVRLRALQGMLTEAQQHHG